MKKHRLKFNDIKKLFISTLFIFSLCISVNAANLYWDGAGTWDTGTSNWGTGTGGPYNTGPWNNAAPDSAIFEGTAGTVTVGTSISAGNLYFQNTSGGYVFTGSEISIATGATITNNITSGTTTFNCAVTGSPNVILDAQTVDFSPDSGNTMLGVVTVNSGTFTIGGNTSNNSLSSIPKVNSNYTFSKNGTGTWTVGDLYGGYIHINAGTVIANGTLKTDYRYIALNSGATLHYNNPGAIQDRGSDGGQDDWWLSGGNLDNTSGAAITTSTTNPYQQWKADWTFIGSNGANSDLNLGTGGVLLKGNYTVTIANSATTLTEGGVVSDGGLIYTLTKAGSGNLKLTGFNTYTGATVINEGILTVTQKSFSSTANVSVAAGATLNLDFSGTVNVGALYLSGNVKSGTWGAIGSGSEYEDSSIRGSGNIYSSYGTAATGIRYWDGGSSDIGSVGDSTAAGGAGTWNTSTTNWDAGTGVAHAAWNNSNNDTAHFGTSTGTVTVASSITAGNLYFENAAGYTFTGSEINIATGGNITHNTTSGTTTTFNCAVTGSPNVIINAQSVDFSPDSGSTTLGIITGGSITIGGSTTNNSLISKPNTGNYSFTKSGMGTWTVGDVYGGYIYISAGTLIANGTLSNNYRQIELNSGATLHYNNAGAIQDRGDTNHDWNLNGGSIDNTSGSAITTSTTNPRQRWYADWEFIGSNGASSDLTLGNGDVVLYTANRTITITHAQTTLTVAGVIQGAYGLTKSGNGTFKTTGINTYTGNTTILAGTLSLSGGSSLVDSTTLYIGAGSNVYLANDETVDALYIEGIQAWAGSWGSTSSNSTYKDNIYFSGAGNLTVTNGATAPTTVPGTIFSFE